MITVLLVLGVLVIDAFVSQPSLWGGVGVLVYTLLVATLILAPLVDDVRDRNVWRFGKAEVIVTTDGNDIIRARRRSGGEYPGFGEHWLYVIEKGDTFDRALKCFRHPFHINVRSGEDVDHWLTGEMVLVFGLDLPILEALFHYTRQFGQLSLGDALEKAFLAALKKDQSYKGASEGTLLELAARVSCNNYELGLDSLGRNIGLKINKLHVEVSQRK